MKLFFFLLPLTLLCASCGYQQASVAGKREPISVAIVKNDENGVLRGQLAQKMGETNIFQYSSSNNAKYELLIDVGTDRIETVGHSKGIGKSSGKVVPTQGNRFMTAKVKVIEKATKKEVVPPFAVSASVDFDFMNPASDEDIYWKLPSGEKVETLHYSYGQLDLKETAEKECGEPLFEKLSSQIIQVLSRVSIAGA